MLQSCSTVLYCSPIHCTVSKNIVFRKLLVNDRGKIAVKCLQISFLIPAFFLYGTIKRIGQAQSVLSSANLIVNGQCINRKCKVISVLDIIKYGTVCIYRPEYSAVSVIQDDGNK